MPMSAESLALAHAVSRIFGWIYFLSWSISFYPQFLLNLRRRTTTGTTPDFPTANILGFTVLALSTGLLFFSPHVRAQYAARHPNSPLPTVRANDFAFAAHGAVVCATIWTQYVAPGLWGFDTVKARVSWPFRILCWGGILLVCAAVLWVAIFGEGSPNALEWLDVVYILGYVKLILTLVKYMPQVYLNYNRRSTYGWAISTLIYDLTGGIFSLAQLGLDSALLAANGQGWRDGVFGNPVKLFLGNISMAFDVVFLLQHFVLFGPVKRGIKEDDVEEEAEDDDDQRPLLAG